MLDDIDAFTDLIWQTLNEANKISLFVRFVSLRDGQVTDRLINKHI
jgi:hypothetical protein